MNASSLQMGRWLHTLQLSAPAVSTFDMPQHACTVLGECIRPRGLLQLARPARQPLKQSHLHRAPVLAFDAVLAAIGQPDPQAIARIGDIS